MDAAKNRYTAESFAYDLRQSVQKNLRGNGIRSLANNTKASLALVEEWLNGDSLPSPNVFNRITATLPDLAHWRPHYREVHQRKILEEVKKQVAPPPPPPSSNVTPLYPLEQTLVAYRRKKAAEPPPPPPVEELKEAAKEEEWWVQLRKLREEAGLTEADLAKMLGVTRGAICFWERGESIPGGPRRSELLTLWPQLEGVLPPPRRVEKEDKKKEEETVVEKSQPAQPAQPAQPEEGTRKRPRKGAQRAEAVFSGIAWFKALTELQTLGALAVVRSLLERAERENLAVEDLAEIVVRFQEEADAE